MRRAALCAGLAWAVVAATGLGHGLVSVPLRDGGVGAQACYDDGTPVSFGEVRVEAPGGAGEPALTGLTDRNGCFMFRPDTNGVWRVKIDDGMGHAVTQEVPVDGAPAAGAGCAAAPLPRRHGVVTGVAVIFGLAGWTAFLRLRAGRRGQG